MTTDTAQPDLAAENVALDDAANAFKVHLGQIEAPPARDDKGRFASATVEESDEIEAAPADDGAGDPEEIDAETADEDGAADEAQLDPIEMPAFWGTTEEDAAQWSALPPLMQASVVRREGQRDAATNQKFQEAANARKAHEAAAAEAQTRRDEAAFLIDQVTSLIQPQRPPVSMLNPNSSDYNPDAYHLHHAQFEQSNELLNVLTEQRQNLAAQHKRANEEAENLAFEAIERTARPALFAAVPDLADPKKAGPVLNEIVAYAVEQGIPADVFTESFGKVTSAELHIAWKAKEYDRLMAAKTKVRDTPKPAPRPAQPAVRPGVTTPRAAVEQTRFKGAMERLGKSGSVEDGAAVFKHLLKGTKL